ncbi:hypothetical protein C0992_000692, partial [Termitomyces sp. T32_za158]
MDTPSFGKAVDAAKAINALFDKAFGEGQLQEWGGDESDENVFSIANRYLTPIDEVGAGEVHIPFDKNIDPNGALGKMAKAGHIRTADNVVNYMRRKIGPNGKAR